MPATCHSRFIHGGSCNCIREGYHCKYNLTSLGIVCFFSIFGVYRNCYTLAVNCVIFVAPLVVEGQDFFRGNHVSGKF